MPNMPPDQFHWHYQRRKNHAYNLPKDLRPIRKKLYPFTRIVRRQVCVRFDNDPLAHERLIKLAQKYGRSPGEQLKRMAFDPAP